MQKKVSLVATSVLASILAWICQTGCSSTSDRWTGSVDAVFRYRSQENTTVVYEVRPKSSSKEAGLKPGDLLLAVDGKDVTNAPYGMIRAALRGPVGTKAKLTVKRDEKILDFEIERLHIKSDEKTNK